MTTPATVIARPTRYTVQVDPNDPARVIVSTSGPQGPPGADGADGAPGPTGPVGAPVYSAENKDSATIAAGGAAAVHPSGVGIVRASANGPGTAAIGLAVAAIAPTFAGEVQTDWRVTSADWSAVTTEGNPTLAARATYYLSTTPGKITTTAPTAAGKIVQVIGYAIAADTLELAVSDPILL